MGEGKPRDPGAFKEAERDDEMYYEWMNSDHTKERKRMNEWISVEDSLPSEADDVLVYSTQLITDDEQFGTIDIAAVYPGGWDSESESFQYGKVTHWMPLPKPPGVK